MDWRAGATGAAAGSKESTALVAETAGRIKAGGDGALDFREQPGEVFRAVGEEHAEGRSEEAGYRGWIGLCIRGQRRSGLKQHGCRRLLDHGIELRGKRMPAGHAALLDGKRQRDGMRGGVDAIAGLRGDIHGVGSRRRGLIERRAVVVIVVTRVAGGGAEEANQR